MKITIKTRSSRADVRRAIALLPALLSGKVADPTGIVRALGIRMGMVALSHAKQAFIDKAAGGTDQAGERWEPLKPETVKARRSGKGTGSVQILRDTGILLNSMSPAGPFSLLESIPGGVSIGTNCPYATFQHNGTPTIPARRLWPEPYRWPDAWMDDIGGEARNGIVQLLVSLVKGTP